ncbi:hypothetical protein RJ639_030568 [Escallonia herrerae]|uniref:AB hydrolase-1 domain-containing protein n=1 Tax=Escallonia herrerae TaxID=1293975 RepID=A0AA89BJ00_9ASTE|nr:hypothetical protein RJ639_030568 [Escallonia herrerae]
MTEVTGTKTWREELASLVEDTGIRYTGDASHAIGSLSPPAFEVKRSEFIVGEAGEHEPESFKDQVKGFAKAWGEIVVELGRGCRDVVQQSLLTDDSYVVKKIRGLCTNVSCKLRFLNEYLPEDRDPLHAWPVIISVFILALAALNVSRHDCSVPLVKKVIIHPPSATRIVLPDGRHMAYHEQGVSSDKARFSIIAPHGFLSSRLAGIPPISASLLEAYGVRLVTYDLPGFGESDSHPNRSLNSSALDMLYLMDTVALNDKFWIVGYSSGAMHAWAALKYIPNRIAGAAMFAPMVNPYESSMRKEEMSRTWEKWTRRRKLMYYLARRFPKFLNYFYHQSFLSGKHGQIDKWLSLSLGNKDEALIKEPMFEEIWHRNVEESIRQGSSKPFIEEASLQVSKWGFSLSDLQPEKKCPGKGILPWFSFMYSQAECEITGFVGPIHIWQGMDDQVVPPSVTDYVARVLPNVIVHKLPEEGHFSYFFFCDKCHKEIFSTLFGSPQGPIRTDQQKPSKEDAEEASASPDYTLR